MPAAPGRRNASGLGGDPHRLREVGKLAVGLRRAALEHDEVARLQRDQPVVPGARVQREAAAPVGQEGCERRGVGRVRALRHELRLRSGIDPAFVEGLPAPHADALAADAAWRWAPNGPVQADRVVDLLAGALVMAAVVLAAAAVQQLLVVVTTTELRHAEWLLRVDAAATSRPRGRGTSIAG